MHIHKIITIKSICISPSNFFTVHSTQLTQEIILNINSTKKEKRLREEGSKMDEERREGMWSKLEGGSDKEGSKL